MRKYIEIEQKCCKQHFYNWEDSSVLLILVASSQPCLIFSIFFLKHGRSSMHLHTRTTIGRKTAIIKVGGVYHTNCFISTHLFQAKISACIVPSRRETIPSLLCKRKKNYLVEDWFNKFIPSYFIWICSVAWKFLHSSIIVSLLHFLAMSTHTFPFFYMSPLTLLLGNAFVSRLFNLRKFKTILLSVSANQ